MIKIINFKFSLLYIFAIIISTIFVINCDVQKDIDYTPKVSIGIINPAVESLQGFANLVDYQIINIEDLQFVAICYDKAERDFSTVEKYIENSDYFTIDVADFIDNPPDDKEIEKFINYNMKYQDELIVPGINKSFNVTTEILNTIANKFLFPIKMASRIYNKIHEDIICKLCDKLKEIIDNE